MSNNWPKVKLGEVLAYRKEFINIDDLSGYKRARVQLHAQGVVVRDEIPGALIKTKHQQVCRSGEFLVAEIDAKVGGYGLVPEALDGAIVSSHYFLFAIDDTKLNKKFLDFFIRTPHFGEQVAAQGSTNYAAIRPSHVLNYEIPLPPMPEQRMIVAQIEAFVTKIHEARQLRRQAADEADALIESIAHQILGETKPSCALGDGLFELIYRYPTFYDIKYTENGVGLLKIGNLTQERWDISFENQRAFISTDTSLKFPKTILEEGDLIMAARGATIGKTAYVTRDFAGFNINANLLRLKPNSEKLNGKFFWYFMCSPLGRDQFRALVTSTAKETVTVPKLKTMLVPLPPLREQCLIVAHLDGLQKRVDALRVAQDDTSAALDAFIPSILDQAFRGEL